MQNMKPCIHAQAFTVASPDGSSACLRLMEIQSSYNILTGSLAFQSFCAHVCFSAGRDVLRCSKNVTIDVTHIVNNHNHTKVTLHFNAVYVPTVQ